MKRNTTPEAAIKAFSRHRATLSERGGVTLLDWSRPDDSTYAMHVLFIPALNRVVICGDLYDCVICPTCACTLEAVAKCFTWRRPGGELETNEGYFVEKVTASKGLYCYDSEDACERIGQAYRDKYGDPAESDYDEDRPSLDDILDEVSDAFTPNGLPLTPTLSEALSKLDGDWWEWAGDLGKRYDTFVTWWLVGLRLAWEQLQGKELG